MKELKSSKKIEFSDLLYCRNVLIAFPFAVIWTRYYKFKGLQRIYLLHMDRMETYSYLISICFVLPPNRLKISAPFKLNNKKYYSSLLCYFSYLFAFFVCSSIYLNAWLTWHDFHIYFCHFTKINTIYNVELFFNLCCTERDRMLDIFYETNEKISSSISLQSILKKESYLLTHLLSDIVFQFTKPRHVSEEASSLAP